MIRYSYIKYENWAQQSINWPPNKKKCPKMGQNKTGHPKKYMERPRPWYM